MYLRRRILLLFFISLLILIIFISVSNILQYGAHKQYFKDRDLSIANQTSNLIVGRTGGINQRRQNYLSFVKQDVLHLEKPGFLPGLKNPCWYENASKGSLSKTLHCFPYFILIGQAKCGTTDLFRKIVTHPDIASPPVPDSMYWAWNRHCKQTSPITYRQICNKRRPMTWTQYRDFFNKAAKNIQDLLLSGVERSQIQIVTGEKSPSLLWDHRWWWDYEPNIGDEEAPVLLNVEYIKHFLPNVKMLCTLRNPVDRLYSDYLFVNKALKSAGPESFHEKVVREIILFKDCLKNHSIRYCVYHNTYLKVNTTTGVRIHLGFYVIYIRDWLARFPRNQFLFLRLEDYASSKTETLKKIYKFLGLRDVNLELEDKIENERTTSKKSVGEMLPETRPILEELYRPFNEELAEVLNDKDFLWLD